MNTKERDGERGVRLLEAISPVVDSFNLEVDRYESNIKQLNRNLRRRLTMRSANSGEPIFGGPPRLLFLREDSAIPGLVTATLVWKIDGELPLQEAETGMFDDAGIMHQCTDDGHYSRDNFDEALPTAQNWAIDQIWNVELEVREIRSRLNAIRGFASTVEHIRSFSSLEILAGHRLELEEDDSAD